MGILVLQRHATGPPELVGNLFEWHEAAGIQLRILPRMGAWVAFPMAEDPCAPRRRVVAVRRAAHPMADLAVVECPQRAIVPGQ